MLSKDVDISPVIIIDNYKFDVIHQFTQLKSTISTNLFLNAEISKHIDIAAIILDRFKMANYNDCIISTWLYGSEAKTTYICQTRAKAEQLPHALTSPHPWHQVERQSTQHPSLAQTGSSPYTELRQCRLCWFGHICQMEDGHIPNDILYSELASGK